MMKSDYICPKTIHAHMESAKCYANLSYAKKHKVGCLIVKYNTPIASGLNGTLPGDDNNCEAIGASLVHAECNALKKLIRLNESSVGSIAVVTREPCGNCVKEMWMAGITKVVFLNIRSSSHEGFVEAKNRGIELYHLTDTTYDHVEFEDGKIKVLSQHPLEKNYE